MATDGKVQINPPGMTNTTEGYISSITVYTNASADALTPDATTGQISVSAAAVTNLVQHNRNMKLIIGGVSD